MRVLFCFCGVVALALALHAQQGGSGVSPDSKLLKMQSVPASKILRKVPPMYPQDAVDQHVHGIVKLSVTIGTTGHVEHIKIISGHPLLAPAAIHAVRKWEFEPFEQGERPVKVLTEIDVPFNLDASGHPVAAKP
ncbi:MAG TPA: energy transducer TonB [Bryobacteraceae bacterium]|nr:energy transducer TonB [Bryobacteraceae bacterium]